jgi:hypothetical protein
MSGRWLTDAWHNAHVGIRGPAESQELRRRLAALAVERQACFALACAKHLVEASSQARKAELLGVIARGWAALLGAHDAAASMRSRLSTSNNLDDDEVAAVAFALDAVNGVPESAYWAASRALDAAFKRVPYEDEKRTFRPLAVDAARPIVQQEVAWQRQLPAQVEGPTALSELVVLVRRQGRGSRGHERPS